MDGLLHLPARMEDIAAQVGALATSTAKSTAELSAKMDTLAAENEELRMRIGDLEGDRAAQSETIQRLTTRLAAAEHNLVNRDLLISGVPEDDAESLTVVMLSIATRLATPLSAAEISEVTRVKSTRDSDLPRMILARFTTIDRRNQFLAAKRKAGHIYADELGIPGEHPHRPVFLNERLSSEQAALLRKVKDMAKKMSYRFVWTRNGKILVKRESASEPITISTEEDIALLSADQAGPSTSGLNVRNTTTVPGRSASSHTNSESS